MSFCPQCGTSNADDARFCEKCGTAIAGSAPPQAPAPQGQQAAQVSDQAKAMAGSAVEAVKKLDPKILIAAIVVVVLLTVGIVVTRPMDKRDYEKAAEDQVEEIYDSWSDIYSAVYDLTYADDMDDELDEDDVEDLQDTFKEESKNIKAAAREINGLRPPSEYKDADKDLRIWSDYMSGAGLKRVEEIVDQAGKKGTTYEDIADLVDDLEDEDDESEDAFDAFYDAVEELEIDY